MSECRYSKHISSCLCLLQICRQLLMLLLWYVNRKLNAVWKQVLLLLCQKRTFPFTVSCFVKIVQRDRSSNGNIIEMEAVTVCITIRLLTYKTQNRCSIILLRCKVEVDVNMKLKGKYKKHYFTYNSFKFFSSLKAPSSIYSILLPLRLLKHLLLNTLLIKTNNDLQQF